MELAAKQDAETEEQELVMQLSPLYLEQLEAARLDGERRGEQRGELIGEQRGELIGEQRGELIGEQRGRQNLVLLQLSRQVRDVPIEVVARVRSLSTEQLDSLGAALLDFEGISDILTWLQENEV